MSNLSAKGDGQRRRNLAAGQATLSSWHYAAQPDIQEIKLNTVALANETGARYARHPNEADASKLVRYFHGYLLKYADLLARGTLSKEGKRIPADTRRFLALFRPASSDRSRPMTFGEMKIIADRIPNAFVTMTADDIYNEMVLLFLELARKFNPEIGGFTGYLGYHFKYALKQRMFQVQRDAMNYQPLFEEEMETLEFTPDSEDDEIHEAEAGYEDGSLHLLEAIGLRQLNHSLVSSPPEHLELLLTKIQRKVLVLVYCEGLSFSQVSRQLNFGNATEAKLCCEAAVRCLRSLIDFDTLRGD